MRHLTRLAVLVLLATLLTTLLPGQTGARAAAPAGVAPAATAPVTAPATAPAQAKARYCANGRPSHYYRDRTDDGPRGVEASGIGVWNKDADACYWVTATGRFAARKAQVIRVVVDTRGDRRYEYQAFAYSQKDRDNRRGAFLVRYYEDADGTVRSQYVACRLFSAFKIKRGEIRLGIPKTCLGSPGHIRVQAAIFDITKYKSGNRWRGYADFVPNGRYTPEF